MNAPMSNSLRSSAQQLTRLKAWRKRQMVCDVESGTRRVMRITDTERLHGIKAGTWHAWEQPVGHQAFRRPDADNMRLLFEITGGEIGPEDFYPVDEWRETLPTETASG